MKSKVIRWIWYATIILVTLTIMSSYNVTFKWVFSLTIIGQAVLIYTVFLVLKDDYKTELTFKDGYQDRPYRDNNEIE